MKRSKQDKQFMMQLDISNRDFLTNISTFILSFVISVVSLFVSVIAVIIALEGITPYSIGATIFFSILAIIITIFYSCKIKKMNQDSKKLNKQYQEKLFETYPEYRKKLY